MNVSQVRLVDSNQKYQKNVNPHFKASVNSSHSTNGTNLLLGTITAVSAAAAGVALYKNHKTGKSLKEAYKKLQDTEKTLKAAQDKIDEAQKKLSEAAKEENVSEKNKKSKKGYKKVVKKTKKTLKKGYRKTGEKIANVVNSLAEKFKFRKRNSSSSCQNKPQNNSKFNKINAGQSDIINLQWAQEQLDRRQTSYKNLELSNNALEQEKIRARELRKKLKIEKKTANIELRNQKKIAKNNAQIEMLKNGKKKPSIFKRIANFFKQYLIKSDDV